MLLPVLFAVLFGLVGAGYYFARMILYPKVFSPKEVFEKEVELGRLVEADYKLWPQEEFTIRSPFGYDLFAIYHPVPGSRKTMVISHGITWGLHGMVIYAEMFRKRGWNVLIYDLRNHGRSGGTSTTFGFYERHDLKAVVDWALNRLGAGGTVATMGISLGAVTSIQHAAMDRRVSFVISDCGFSNFTRLVAFRAKADFKLPAFPLVPLANLWCWLLTGMTFGRVSPVNYLAKIDRPIFFIHGVEDDYVPAYMGEENYRAKTRGVRKLYLAPNAGHAESYWKNREEYDRKMGEFLDEIGMA